MSLFLKKVLINYIIELFNEKYNQIVSYINSVTILIKINTYLDQMWINKIDNYPDKSIFTKCLYIKIDDVQNEYGNLDNLISKILIYFDCEIIIIGRQKSRLTNSDTKFTISLEKFNNLIILDD